MRPQVKTTLLVTVLGLSLALNASLAVGYLTQARADARPAAGPETRPNGCLLDRLRLGEAQRSRLAEMRRRMRQVRAAYWKRSRALRRELADAISAPEPGDEKLGALLRRFAEDQAAMQRAAADHLVAVSAMLRPGQREVFRTLLRTEMFRGIRSAPPGEQAAP